MRTVSSQNRSCRRLRSFSSPRSYAQTLSSVLWSGLEQEDFKTFCYIMRQIAALLKAPDWRDSRVERQRLTFIRHCKCHKIFLGQTLYESVLTLLLFEVRGRRTSPAHAGYFTPLPTLTHPSSSRLFYSGHKFTCLVSTRSLHPRSEAFSKPEPETQQSHPPSQPTQTPKFTAMSSFTAQHILR